MAWETHPLTRERWPDLDALFDQPVVRTCFCMYYRRSATGTGVGAVNRRAMRCLVEDGVVPGLLGYEDDVPAAWVSIGQRDDFPRLRRSPTMKPVDDRPVWSIVCFFVDPRERGRGFALRMLDAAVAFASACGVTMVEGYPVDVDVEEPQDDRMFFGTRSMFERAGFKEVARRRPARPVMRKSLR